MGVLGDFLSPEAGQRRTRALNDWLSENVDEPLNTYLGPTGIPDRLKAVAKALEFSDAGDIVETADASRTLWNDPSIENAARYATAGAATAMPFVGARMMNEGVDIIGSAVDDFMTGYDPNTVNIFAGPRARTADLDALGRAERMAEEGASRDDIWSQTGWFRGVDGKWRFEIDDSPLDVGDTPIRPLERYGVFGRADKAISHPEMVKAYDLSDLEFDLGVAPSLRGGSYKSPTYWRTDIADRGIVAGDVQGAGRIRARGSDRDETLDTLLHEMQHDVQRREGFSTGSNVSDEAARLAAERDREMLDAVEAQLTPQEAADLARFRALKAEYDNVATVPGEVVIEVSDLKKRLSRLDTLMDELRAFRKSGRGGALEGGAIDRAEAFNQYQRVAGEAEARNAAARRNMTTDERRATPPWATQDVPDDMQIVRMENLDDARARWDAIREAGGEKAANQWWRDFVQPNAPVSLDYAPDAKTLPLRALSHLRNLSAGVGSLGLLGAALGMTAPSDEEELRAYLGEI